ncbi:alpha/beta hydrolase, partial [Bacillus subtilis]|uniref:alpha/beta fold hydrolase n=1 Tax=Bacillus subtilis TaxID=1423 RepID=UPI0024ACF51A
DALDIDKAVLIGYTAGGIIAQHTGITSPDKVSHLIQSGAYPAVHNVNGQKQHKLRMKLHEKKPRFIVKKIKKTKKQ